MKPALACVPFLALAMPAQIPPVPLDLQHEVRWGVEVHRPPGAGNVTYLRVCPARVGDHDELDVVALRSVDGERGVVAYSAPMRHNVEIGIAADIVDAAVLVTGQPRDPVVVLRGPGLEVYRAGVGALEPCEQPIATIGGSWAGAQCVWSGHDALGTPVLLGVNQAGTKILRARWVQGELQQLADVDTVTGTTKVMTMDWDGVGEVELIVQLDAMVVVTSWQGVPITSFVFDPTHGHAVTVSKGAGTEWYARDLLIAYGWLSGQYQLLAAAGIAGSQSAHLALLPLGANNGWTANDLQAFELDNGAAPRLEDLVLANRNDAGLPPPPRNARAWIVRRTNDAAVFAAPEIMTMVAGSDLHDAAIAAACGADFDGDGDGDVIGLQSTMVTTEQGEPAAASVMQLFASDLAPRRRAMTVLVPEAEPQEGQPFYLGAQVPMPAGWQTVAGPGETLRVEFVGWFTNEGQSEVEASILPCSFELTPGVQLPDMYTLERDATATLSLTPEKWEVLVHTRLVVVGPQGQRRLLPPWVTHCSTGLQNQRKTWLSVVETGARVFPGEPGEPSTGNGTNPPTTEPVRRP